MDMARATRALMECLSCHRCHRFRMAERTCGHKITQISTPAQAQNTHLIPASSRLLQASLTGVVTGSTLGGDIHVITSIGLLLVESVFSNEEETPFFLV